jgi:hypothetical protein
MRIDFKKLEALENAYGRLEVGASKDIFDNPLITLRFGYWREVDLDELRMQFPNNEVQVFDWFDEDCGWLYSYAIGKSINVKNLAK